MNPFVHDLIAQHGSTPASALEKLSHHADANVRYYVAVHQNTAPEIIDRLATDRDPRVAATAAQRRVRRPRRKRPRRAPLNGAGEPDSAGNSKDDKLLAYMVAGFGVAETMAAVAFMEKDSLFFVLFALAGLIPWLGLAWMALRVARSGCSVMVILLASMPMVAGTLVCHFGLASSMREFGGLAYIYATVGLFLIAAAASGVVLLAEGVAGNRGEERRRTAEFQNIQNLPPGKPAVIPPPRRPEAESVRQDSFREHALSGENCSAPGTPYPAVPESPPHGSQLPLPKHERS
jgi:hypothetical protein